MSRGFFISAVKQKLILIAIVALCVAILGFGIAGGVFLGRLLPQAQRPRIANTQAIVTQIQALSQLVTVKYVFEKVVRLDDVKWFGQNRLLMVAHGIAKAGSLRDFFVTLFFVALGQRHAHAEADEEQGEIGRAHV